MLGGGGFLGRYVVQRLLARGARVRIAQRDPRAATFLKPLGGLGQTQFVACDVRDAASVARAVQGSDAVINLAGAFADMQAVQADGAGHVATAAKAAGAGALVHVSAIGADPESPSEYGRTKGLGEEAVRKAFPKATIIRPSLAFGPEDQLTNRFALLMSRLPVYPVIAPDTKFQPVYVGDIAEAYAQSVDGKVPGGRIYELGGPDVLTFRQCMEEMLEITDRKRWLVSVPWWVASLQASVLQLLPNPLLTTDQVTQLKSDNVVSAEAVKEGRTFASLGIQPKTTAAILPSYLWRYRPAGQFKELFGYSAPHTGAAAAGYNDGCFLELFHAIQK